VLPAGTWRAEPSGSVTEISDMKHVDARVQAITNQS